jgi:hypothetical protein
MKKFGIKTITWYGILALVVAVAILPLLKAAAPAYFPSVDGFRDLDCRGVTCPEGQFCAEGKRCVNIATRYPNAVPTGDE